MTNLSFYFFLLATMNPPLFPLPPLPLCAFFKPTVSMNTLLLFTVQDLLNGVNLVLIAVFVGTVDKRTPRLHSLRVFIQLRHL